MDKMDQIEKLKNIQMDVAKKFNLVRLTQQQDLTEEQMIERCTHSCFQALKNEVSSHLSSIDAVFNASVVLKEEDLTADIMSMMAELSQTLQDFISSIASFEEVEEGGDNNA